MTFRVLDPTPEKAPPVGQLAPRLATLEGKTIGFISNGKEGTKGFFAHLDQMLREEHGVAKVVSLDAASPTVTTAPGAYALNGSPPSDLVTAVSTLRATPSGS